MRKNATLLLTFLICISSISAYAQLGKCKGKYLGNITAYSVPSNYTSLWNQTTSENGSKWGTCDRGNGQYNFGNSDLAYNTAKNSGGLFKFHALIWGAQAPGYLKDASAATIETAIRNWYKAVEDHYKPMGGLNFIDVLNEPVNTPINREIANLKAALTMGYQREAANQGDLNNPYGWAIWPFQLARKHFPNATLLINEFNTEHNWNNCRAEYIKMSNAIKNAPNLTDGKKNLIDGIGLQAHGMNGQLNLSAANFKACIDEIWNKTNLPLHITELDLVAEPNEAAQRTKYQEFFTIAWEHPHVAGITLWGYVQGATWIPGNKVSGAGGTDSGIQYANLTDRPAMTWLKQYMASQPSLPCCPAPGPFASCTASLPTVTLTSPIQNSIYTTDESITIEATAADADGTIANVFLYNGTTVLSEQWVAPYDFVWTNVPEGTYTLTAVATDNDGNKTTSAPITITVKMPQSPYKGSPFQIPGKIEAESYDLGGEGLAFHEANTNGNEGGATLRNDEVDIEQTQDAEGGYNVGYILNGEWLEYTVDVASSGIYDLALRVAADGDGKLMHIEVDGVDVTGSIEIPNTGGWQTWETVLVNGLNLTEGKHVIRLVFETDYMNLNYMEFSSVVTGLPNAIVNFKVYPNPFTNVSQIDMQGAANYNISSTSGLILETGVCESTCLVGKNLPTGLYFVNLESEGMQKTVKLIKK